jgi:hypothetical protein
MPEVTVLLAHPTILAVEGVVAAVLVELAVTGRAQVLAVVPKVEPVAVLAVLEVVVAVQEMMRLVAVLAVQLTDTYRVLVELPLTHIQTHLLPRLLIRLMLAQLVPQMPITIHT